MVRILDFHCVYNAVVNAEGNICVLLGNKDSMWSPFRLEGIFNVHTSIRAFSYFSDSLALGPALYGSEHSG